MNGEIYDKDYFLHGELTGKSLYTNYRWMPELTVPMCRAIVEHCKMQVGDRIMDYGCARGYMVKALRSLGYDACGVDVSEWAIANADEDVRPYVSTITPTTCPTSIGEMVDWVIAKDVLEHVPYVSTVIGNLMLTAKRGIFVVVPLSYKDGDNYVVSSYEKDVTHIHRLTLSTWVSMFIRPGWSVEASYRVSGVKDNYSGWTLGNGFITCRRIGL